MAESNDNAGPSGDDAVMQEVKERWKLCQEWYSGFWGKFSADLRFRHGDSDNGWQWPDGIRRSREFERKPCLTMNMVRQHNFQISNNAKQKKAAVKIIATGGAASAESAEIFKGIIRHVENRSRAQDIYGRASELQVDGGLGWWRIVTEYCDDDSFDLDARLLPINDSLSVVLDPDAQEKDKRDSKYGFVFDLVPKGELLKAYPRLRDQIGDLALLGGSPYASWRKSDHVWIAEYFRKVLKKDRLLSFLSPGTIERRVIRESLLPGEIRDVVVDDPLTQMRDIWPETIEWKLIVGERIVDKTIWPGKFIPLIPVLGEESVVDSVYDCKGHTRAMKDAQRMFNYNALLALDTKIPTPSGWTTIADLEPGMEVFDQNGIPIPVKQVLPVHHDEECFEITFSNGYKVITDAGHIWKVEERGKRKSFGFPWTERTICTAELIIGDHFIKLPGPLVLPERDFILDPYLLGLWLGDGHSSGGKISAHEDDAEEEKILIEELGFSISEIVPDREESKGVHFTVEGLKDKLRDLGLLGGKSVPADYLRGSRDQRLALLQGLMDTDGHFAPVVNQCVFINTNKRIIAAVMELCASLGIKATVLRQPEKAGIFPDGKTRISSENFRVQFTADPDVPVFRLLRKASAQTCGRNTHWRRTKRVGIESVISVESIPARCIVLDTPEHLFLCTEGMIPTHNSSQVEFVALQGKTPWVAAAKAVEGYESLWSSANVVNHSVLIYNGVDEDFPEKPIPPPMRTEPPNAAPAYQAGMDTAFNQMMMTSGQWQNQMGMMGNERTGAAINARNDQGDNATFHFEDNLASALRYTGDQFIDLIPKLYNKRKVMRILADDDSDLEVEIDPGAKQALALKMNHQGQVISRVFNPTLGTYGIASDVGPSYASKQRETTEQLTLVLTQAPQLVPIIGDLLLASLGFDKALEAARRMKRMVPPQALGTGPSEAEQSLTQQVAALQLALSKSLEDGAKKEIKLVGKTQDNSVNVYQAETARFKALADALAVEPEGLQAVIRQLVSESLQVHLSPIMGENLGGGGSPHAGAEQPPVPGARKAPDGQYYISHPGKPGKFLRIKSKAPAQAGA